MTTSRSVRVRVLNAAQARSMQLHVFYTVDDNGGGCSLKWSQDKSNISALLDKTDHRVPAPTQTYSLRNSTEHMAAREVNQTRAISLVTRCTVFSVRWTGTNRHRNHTFIILSGGVSRLPGL
jgi:hypothetical protein